MIDAESNFDYVSKLTNRIESSARQKFFVYQPEETNGQIQRNIYERLDEAKKLVKTLPGSGVHSYGIYPAGNPSDFDDFVPVFDDKDWQTRLKNDVILDETDILLINVPKLPHHIVLSFSWLINEGYIPESEE